MRTQQHCVRTSLCSTLCFGLSRYEKPFSYFWLRFIIRKEPGLSLYPNRFNVSIEHHIQQCLFNMLNAFGRQIGWRQWFNFSFALMCEPQHSICLAIKVDFQSVLRRLNGLFWFLFWKTTYIMYDFISEMYQFVTSYIKWNYNFSLPPLWMWALLSMKLKKETIEVAAWPGQDNISVCTCTRFCLRETGRNTCPPSSMRNRKLVRCVLQEDSSENNEVYLSLLYFSHVEKFSYSSKMHSFS